LVDPIYDRPMSTLNRAGVTALVVIDLQSGVVAQCVDRYAVLERTANLVERARAAGTPIVFVQHEEPGMEWGDDGWRLAKPLQSKTGDVMVGKRFMDSFADTTLESELSALGVDRLVVAGAASDYCIRATTHRAAAEGYDVLLISDCHTTEDTEHDGTPMSGVEIIAHTNLIMSRLRYPGQDIGTARAEDVWPEHTD
jgi:nicotinamidase-related amidase